jgi:chemotaxis regulatin CheY-phosphate phosphatase CheZ
MNEEEKKAIELLEDIKNNTWTTKYIMSSDSKNAKVLLNLIEKLQKENKELKESNEILNDAYWNECITKQTIKDKIEYLDNQQKQWLEDRELKASDSEIIFARNFLQELLEGRK